MELPENYTCETSWSLGPRAMRVECSEGHGTARSIATGTPDPCDHVLEAGPCALPVTVIMAGPYQYHRYVRCHDGHEGYANWPGAAEDDVPYCRIVIDGRVCG